MKHQNLDFCGCDCCEIHSLTHAYLSEHFEEIAGQLYGLRPVDESKLQHSLMHLSWSFGIYHNVENNLKMEIRS